MLMFTGGLDSLDSRKKLCAHINLCLLQQPQTQCVKSYFLPENNYVNKRKVECLSVRLCVSALVQLCHLFVDLLQGIFFFLSLCLFSVAMVFGCESFISLSLWVCFNPHHLCLFQSDQVLAWCENHRRCAQVIYCTHNLC